MKDKVSQFREMLQKNKSAEEQKENMSQNQQDNTNTPEENEDKVPVKNAHSKKDGDQNSELTPEETVEYWQDKYQKALDANEIQKNMYLQKVADLENMRKRLQREQDEMSKFANEKLLTEIFPILDSLEMTLSHTKDKKDDPIVQGVELILKQFLQTLEKFGLKEIHGEGQLFDPNVQEAIGTEQNKDFDDNCVTKVHRKGYQLNNRVLRAAMVTVNQS